MPRSSELPDVLRTLARRHAHELSDRRFHADVDQLIEVLERVFATVKPAIDERGEVAGAQVERPIPQLIKTSSLSSLPGEPEMILIPAGAPTSAPNPPHAPTDVATKPCHICRQPCSVLNRPRCLCTIESLVRYLPFIEGLPNVESPR